MSFMVDNSQSMRINIKTIIYNGELFFELDI